MGTLIWLRRGWMREYREALSAAGVDPDRDELVESGDSMAKTMLILFGVFGGFFVFLGVSSQSTARFLVTPLLGR